MTRNEKALATVFQKGRAAALAGHKADSNPYPRTHDGARSTFSGVWWRHWRLGFEEGAKRIEVLRAIFCKGELEQWVGRPCNCGSCAKTVRMQMIGGGHEDIDEGILVELRRLGLIERMAGMMSPDYHRWQISNAGLQLLGKPTREQMAELEVISEAPEAQGQLL